uniref:Uncharacterized protein n=1 Tax=Peronospora matthiolae TaxID=2874970 RepID=A0AAV1TKL3_9STRA
METLEDALVADDMALGLIICCMEESGAKGMERLKRVEQETLAL